MSRALTSSRDGHVYEFAPTMEPVYEAADGESLTIETIDSLNGAIQTDDDRLDAIPEEVNAATGPIAVEGASPGDVLAVEIEDVRVTEDRGRVLTAPGSAFCRTIPRSNTRRRGSPEVDAEGASEQIDFEGIDVPIEPVIGTIGVATAEDRSRRSPRTTTAATSTRPT